MSNKVLIIEDEINLGKTLSEFLIDKGFDCRHAINCKEGDSLFLEFQPNIILMDIQLPDGNGINLAKAFREIRKNFLLLFLSAQNDPETKLAGLEMGADDYITKPFDLRELMLRLEKAIQTFELLGHYQDDISLGALTVLFKSYEVITPSNEVIALGQKECAILEMLYSKKDCVVGRDEIVEQVWGEDSFPSNRTVDNYIVRLRKIMEKDTSGNISIKSVRGVGYQLNINKKI